MTKFDREKALVDHLLGRLGLCGAAIYDPNAAGPETGIDVLVHLSDRRVIGIQVTEVDPYIVRGTARAKEKSISRSAPNKPYFMWGQNGTSIVLQALGNSIGRKVQIAGQHSFQATDEVWLLICAGVPELGAVASTFIMTPWLSPEDMNLATDNVLGKSKYHRCFLLPIVGIEQALYRWERTSGWEKSVTPRDIRDVPREAYVENLLNAANQQERDRLFYEECRMVLREFAV
jgi:hypothetical protein